MTRFQSFVANLLAMFGMGSQEPVKAPSVLPHSVKWESKTKIIVHVGDMMTLPVDCIANAANSGMQGGGGIDGIITANQNPQTGKQLSPPSGDVTGMILKQLKVLKDNNVAPVSSHQLPTGKAVITGSGSIKQQGAQSIRFVVATVGPQGASDQVKNQQLYDAYFNSLTLAINDQGKADQMLAYQSDNAFTKAHPIKAIAFPSISTGIYGYPVDEASKHAMTACLDFVKKHPHALDKIYFVFRSNADKSYQAMRKTVREYQRFIDGPYEHIVTFGDYDSATGLYL